jgi:hypothetical protein
MSYHFQMKHGNSLRSLGIIATVGAHESGPSGPKVRFSEMDCVPSTAEDSQIHFFAVQLSNESS